MTSERNPEKSFMSQKKKMKKSSDWEKVTSIKQWKKGTNLIAGDSMLAGTGQKRISTVR